MRLSRVLILSASLGLTAAMTVLPAEVANAQSPSTAVLVPSNNATVSGSRVILDAGASPGVTQVQFEISGGPASLNDQVVATATPTNYGWIAQWGSTTVSNGSYTLQSVATQGGSSVTSTAISITVNTPAPTVSMVLPSSGATVSGNPAVLDAVASPGVSQVTFNVALSVAPPPCTFVDIPNSPGFYICTITTVPTPYGWIGEFNAEDWANGSYDVFAQAQYPNGESSTPVESFITVDNKAQPTVVVPANGSTVSGTQALDCVIPRDAGAPVTFSLGAGGFLTGATLTEYGWVYEWNTTDVSNGKYSLSCEAIYAFGGSGIGPDISITVSN